MLIEDTPTLDPYQIEGAAFIAARKRAGLFDEPGLGKSAQAVRASEIINGQKGLVICPAGVRQVWPGQFSQWGRGNRRIVKAGSIFDVVAWKRGHIDILVLSYEQAVQWRADLVGEFYDFCIVDEAHYLKNPDTKRTAAVLGENTDGLCSIIMFATHVWLLTGTPIKNDPSDLWVPLRVAGKTTLDYTTFMRRYFKQRIGTFSVSNTARPEMLPELRAMLSSMSLMRTFDDVGQQLPPFRLAPLDIDGDNASVVEYLRQYPGLSERILAVVRDNATLSFSDKAHVSTLRALIAEAKAPGYARLVTEELRSCTIDKLVIMGNHRAALELVNGHLNRHNIKSGLIFGGVSEAARTHIVSDFQSEKPGSTRVIVGNIVAAGTGLTLTKAHRLDMLESSWTPTDNVQAIRRVRRRGQTRSSLVRFVTLLNSFDAVVQKIVLRKATTIVSITQKENLGEAMVETA